MPVLPASRGLGESTEKLGRGKTVISHVQYETCQRSLRLPSSLALGRTELGRAAGSGPRSPAWPQLGVGYRAGAQV